MNKALNVKRNFEKIELLNEIVKIKYDNLKEI